MVSQCEGLHHGIADLFAGLVDALDQAGRHPETSGGSRIAQIAQHRLQGAQGLARPVDADLAEQAMLNRIPLRATRRVVTDRNRQPQPVAKLALKLLFP